MVEVNKYFKIINLAFALSFVLCSHVKNYSYALEHNHSVTDFKLKKNVADLVFEGLERTKEPWLRSYLNIDFPSELSLSDLDEIRSKILTTGVFHRAEVIFVEAKGKTYARIRVSEKWTTIPVVRAEVGGGTPLYVAGIYDQHSFGRLLTLGSEFRKYGDENPGFVMWFKSPRHAGGKYNLGIELWNEIRKRTFYDNLGNEEALFTDRKKRVRAYFLSESSFVSVKGFKIGLDLEYSKRESAELEIIDEDLESNSLLVPEAGDLVKAAVVIHTDSVDVDNYDYDGLRNVIEVGVSREAGQNFSRYRLESFYYKILYPLNFAAHFEVSGTQNKSAAEQSFLGGFGSVRGYPDGIERGTNRYYGNFELRHIGLRYEKVQFQFSSFVDIGKAGSSLEALESEPKKSYGVGLRVASPNVHRLMFRIDYGRSFDGKFEGISLGLNQYFQPYRPL